jgi:hypothetical protein
MGIYQLCGVTYSVSMGIIEIWIPEIIVVLFLALPLLRPFSKKLWPLDGLTLLPLVALGITIGIFPAYGFRPECIPILVFAFFASVTSRHNDSFRDRGPLLTVCAFILLIAVTIPLFAFSSRVGNQAYFDDRVSEPAKELQITDRMVLKVYGAIQANRPLIFVVPPEIGSAASVDMVCAELQKKNFTVVTYYAKEPEFSWRRFDFFVKPLARLQAFGRGTRLVSANVQGKALEAERRTEIESLLPQLPVFLGYTHDNPPPFLLAGYGAGGSALAYLAGENNFIARHNNVIGVVAIESRLWSSYHPESRDIIKVPVGEGIILRQWANIVRSLNSLWPQQVRRTGSLPDTGLPVLHLFSGRALDIPVGQKPYEAIFDSMRSSSGPIALAAIEGAGPLDFQDFPFTHPIYSFLLPGLKNAEKSKDPISTTTAIIANFASLLLDQEEFNLPSHPINGKLYLETKGFPQL